MNPEIKPFPKGCTITDIRRGEGECICWVFAILRGPNEEVLITATLDYINDQILRYGIEK